MYRASSVPMHPRKRASPPFNIFFHVTNKGLPQSPQNTKSTFHFKGNKCALETVTFRRPTYIHPKLGHHGTLTWATNLTGWRHNLQISTLSCDSVRMMASGTRWYHVVIDTKWSSYHCSTNNVRESIHPLQPLKANSYITQPSKETKIYFSVISILISAHRIQVQIHHRWKINELTRNRNDARKKIDGNTISYYKPKTIEIMK